MGKNMVQKIMEAHLVSGMLNPGSEVGITVDQTLIQDATGTMALLQFEAMGIPRVWDSLINLSSTSVTFTTQVTW